MSQLQRQRTLEAIADCLQEQKPPPGVKFMIFDHCDDNPAYVFLSAHRRGKLIRNKGLDFLMHGDVFLIRHHSPDNTLSKCKIEEFKFDVKFSRRGAVVSDTEPREPEYLFKFAMQMFLKNKEDFKCPET